jgi:phospholipase/lecithinase/hemolysin
MRFSTCSLLLTGAVLSQGAVLSTPFRVAREFAQEALAISSLAGKGPIGSPKLLQQPTPKPGSSGLSYPGFKNLDYLFVFGDSYTQTGFNITNGSPLPTPSNPLGNPTYPGWTSTNGPNWVGYLTTTYNASLLQTYNFAYGGATINADLVAPYREEVYSLGDQIEGLFVPHTDHSIWKAKNSLFLIWIGVNDIGSTYWSGEWDTFHPILLDEYFRLVDVLYAQGARNFVFLDVPPIELSPGTLQYGEETVLKERGGLASFNAKLKERVKNLTKTRKGTWAKVFESSKVFTEIIEAPAEKRLEKYGIANVTEYCVAYQK